MDRKDLSRYYADNMGLIHVMARKGYGRLQAIGASIGYDDLVQDLSEVFIKAYDLFNEDAGAKFSTYFIFSARNEINKIAERYERERTGGVVVSVEKNQDEYGYEVKREYFHAGTSSFEDLNAMGDDDGCSIEETIASDCPTPEEIVCAGQVAMQMIEQLSPLAAQIAVMAINPPDFIEREFVALQAHAEYARSVGMERRGRAVINVSFVASVLEKVTNVPPSHIRAAKNEIVNLAKRGI